MSRDEGTKPYDPKAWEAERYQTIQYHLRETRKGELVAVLFLISVVSLVIFSVVFAIRLMGVLAIK